jgi:hypothetical protein
MSLRKRSRAKVLRTTIAVKITTKNRLDRDRFTGQSYDGFICHLLDSWEKQHKENFLVK